MTNQIALLLRVFLFYPLAGLVAALPFIDYDKAAAVLTIDPNAGAAFLAVLIWGLVSGGTFAWSRWVKALGGEV